MFFMGHQLKRWTDAQSWHRGGESDDGLAACGGAKGCRGALQRHECGDVAMERSIRIFLRINVIQYGFNTDQYGFNTDQYGFNTDEYGYKDGSIPQFLWRFVVNYDTKLIQIVPMP